MNMLYPIKFKPILKEMIWGGKRIPDQLGILLEEGVKIGENFLISGLKNDVSIVENGFLRGQSLLDLIDKYKGDILGHKVYEKFGNEFPLLIKFIDANDDLSIQVHPNDALAKRVHQDNGKTEMWYVVDAEENASLISGFIRPISAPEFTQYYKDGKLMDLMRNVKTHKGDTFFIQSGRVHSIGKGNLIAEIQQNSNITYRIYDFNRVDSLGNHRELHHELAMDAIDFNDDDSGQINYSNKVNEANAIVNCPYFTTQLIHLNGSMDLNYQSLDSFVVLINTEGECILESDSFVVDLNIMEAVLIPNCIDQMKLKTKSKANILQVHISNDFL